MASKQEAKGKAVGVQVGGPALKRLDREARQRGISRSRLIGEYLETALGEPVLVPDPAKAEAKTPPENEPPARKRGGREKQEAAK